MNPDNLAKRLQLFMSAVMADPRATESPFDAGLRFIRIACEGAGARAAVDDNQGNVTEMERLGVMSVPEASREAWLFGYRWQPDHPQSVGAMSRELPA